MVSIQPKYKDMLGKTFERLVVIGLSDKRAENGQVIWKCMCDCGSIVYARGDGLRSGKVKSCGCWKREKCIEANFKDITGSKFGRLVVCNTTKKRSGENVVWTCVCDCGNIVDVAGNSLRSGHTKSCGCLQKDRASEANLVDLIDKRFGRLVVIERTENRVSNCVVWKCRCDCGKTTLVRGSTLVDGGTKSCGCYKKDINRERFTTHGLSGTKEYSYYHNHKRRELKKLYDSEVTLELETALKDFFPACILCGSTDRLAIDHVLPLSRGYGLKPGNAVVLCKSCNSSKNDKNINDLPLEWQADLIWNAFKFKDHWQQLEHSQGTL